MSAEDIIATLSAEALTALKAHSPVGPSSGDRWVMCPGSVLATIDMPDTQSEYAAEGSFAHDIGERALNDSKDIVEYASVTSDDGEWKVDREMIDTLQDYIDYCDQFEGDYLVETSVSYDAWVDMGWGTSDFIAFDEDAKQCIVIDLKYGKGIEVKAKNNYQLMLYALGVYQDWGADYEIDSFLLCISQPRLGHRDQWEVSVEKLLIWAVDIIEPAGKLAWSENAPFKAGAWCQWCKIKGECKTRAKMMRDVALIDLDDLDELDLNGKPATAYPNIMSNDEIGDSARVIPLIKKWCEEVMELVKKRVMANEKIPSGYDEDGEVEHYKMVTGRSTRDWKEAEDAKKALRAAKLKVDEYAPRSLVTPPVAEKLLGKKHKIFIVDKTGNGQYVVKPQGKPVLVTGDDHREPYKISTDELDDEDIDMSFLDE